MWATNEFQSVPLHAPERKRPDGRSPPELRNPSVPKLSEKFSLLFWREGGDDFLELSVPAQWVP